MLKLNDWIFQLYKKEKKIYSQGKQDGVIESIIENIKIDNHFCVEFGYDSIDLESGGGPNTTNLIKNHNWNYLLLDQFNENVEINLHKYFLNEANICHILKMHNVPEFVGYISIDVDSSDLWLTNSILQKFKPCFFSVEFNSNFPIDYAFTFPKHDEKGWIGDKVYGASLKALNICANNYNYSLVYAGILGSSHHHDAFFVRNDLLPYGIKKPTLENFRNTYSPVHRSCTDNRYKIMLDYEEYLLNQDIQKSQKQAEPISIKYLCS